jgi:hypothetical protein
MMGKKKVTALKAKHAVERQQDRERHDEAMASLRRDTHTEVESLKTVHAATVKALKAGQVDVITSMKARHAEALKAAKSKKVHVKKVPAVKKATRPPRGLKK